MSIFMSLQGHHNKQKSYNYLGATLGRRQVLLLGSPMQCCLVLQRDGMQSHAIHTWNCLIFSTNNLENNILKSFTWGKVSNQKAETKYEVNATLTGLPSKPIGP